jgi:hypothetical protein
METKANVQAVDKLIAAAAGSLKSDDALRFSQAACNVANAMCAVGSALAGGVSAAQTIA